MQTIMEYLKVKELHSASSRPGKPIAQLKSKAKTKGWRLMSQIIAEAE